MKITRRKSLVTLATVVLVVAVAVIFTHPRQQKATAPAQDSNAVYIDSGKTVDMSGLVVKAGSQYKLQSPTDKSQAIDLDFSQSGIDPKTLLNRSVVKLRIKVFVQKTSIALHKLVYRYTVETVLP